MPRALLIEDRRENIVFIANNILKPLGYEVITARDGESGLIKAQKESPNVIITDLKLPALGGLDVLEKLNQKGIHIPAIVMTFHGTEETVVRALRLGVKDYLIKPFTIEEMEAALQRALRPKRELPSVVKTRNINLEQQLLQVRALAAEQERQIAALKKELGNSVGKVDMAEVAQRAAIWEEDNARLRDVLAHTKDMLNSAEKRAVILEKAMTAQKVQIAEYKEKVKRFSEELRNLSEVIHLMSEDLDHQHERLTLFFPQNNTSPILSNHKE
jgi:DNA-binding response OmpR family regulator